MIHQIHYYEKFQVTCIFNYLLMSILYNTIIKYYYLQCDSIIEDELIRLVTIENQSKVLEEYVVILLVYICGNQI